LSEKTEAPTGRRISEAREEGRVARSIELNAAMALLIGTWLIKASGKQMVVILENLMTSTLITLPEVEPSQTWLQSVLFSSVMPLVPGLVILLVGLLVTGVSVTLAQTGLMWANKRVGFDFSRLNPVPGFKRIFSAQGLVELIKALLKLLIVGWVAYSFLRGHVNEMLSLVQMDLSTGISIWTDLGISLMQRVGLAYIVLALADYGYQRWQHIRSMKMTKEEVKEDMKSSEGDPFIRSRIRGQQRRMARMRMMSNVKKADVVIINPTHLAVAVRYVPEEMNAPKLLAKGAHRTAQRIVELARQHNIPVIQNIPVARALYRAVEIDQEIPSELYAALAEVLAYVYKVHSKPRFETNPEAL